MRCIETETLSIRQGQEVPIKSNMRCIETHHGAVVQRAPKDKE